MTEAPVNSLSKAAPETAAAWSRTRDLQVLIASDAPYLWLVAVWPNKIILLVTETLSRTHRP